MKIIKEKQISSFLKNFGNFISFDSIIESEHESFWNLMECDNISYMYILLQVVYTHLIFCMKYLMITQNVQILKIWKSWIYLILVCQNLFLYGKIVSHFFGVLLFLINYAHFFLYCIGCFGSMFFFIFFFYFFRGQTDCARYNVQFLLKFSNRLYSRSNANGTAPSDFLARLRRHNVWKEMAPNIWNHLVCVTICVYTFDSFVVFVWIQATIAKTMGFSNNISYSNLEWNLQDSYVNVIKSLINNYVMEHVLDLHDFGEEQRKKTYRKWNQHLLQVCLK